MVLGAYRLRRAALLREGTDGKFSDGARGLSGLQTQGSKKGRGISIVAIVCRGVSFTSRETCPPCLGRGYRARDLIRRPAPVSLAHYSNLFLGASPTVYQKKA
jgi:hypothetical protein